MSHSASINTSPFSLWTGPEAYSFDISFPGVDHIYGLAEHASPLSLPPTECVGDWLLVEAAQTC